MIPMAPTDGEAAFEHLVTLTKNTEDVKRLSLLII